MASFIVDAAGYSIVALPLRQMALVARSSSTMPIDPGEPTRYFSTAVILRCMRQEKRGGFPEQLGVGRGDGGEDSGAPAVTVTRARVAKSHRAALPDPGNTMIPSLRGRSQMNNLLRLLADCSRPGTRGECAFISSTARGLAAGLF